MRFSPWPAAARGLCGPPTSGMLGHRSILLPTSMSGSGLSVTCGRGGWLRAPWGWQPPAAVAPVSGSCRALLHAPAASHRACAVWEQSVVPDPAQTPAKGQGWGKHSRCSWGWPCTLLSKGPSSLLSGSCSPGTVWGTAQPSSPRGSPKAPAPLHGAWAPLGPFPSLDLSVLADAEEAAWGADAVEEQRAVGFAEVGLGDALVPGAGVSLLWGRAGSPPSGFPAAGAVTASPWGCCWSRTWHGSRSPSPCALTFPAQRCPRSVTWLPLHLPAAALSGSRVLLPCLCPSPGTRGAQGVVLRVLEMSPLNLCVKRRSRKLDFPIPCQHQPVRGAGGPRMGSSPLAPLERQVQLGAGVGCGCARLPASPALRTGWGPAGCLRHEGRKLPLHVPGRAAGSLPGADAMVRGLSPGDAGE